MRTTETELPVTMPVVNWSLRVVALCPLTLVGDPFWSLVAEYDALLKRVLA